MTFTTDKPFFLLLLMRKSCVCFFGSSAHHYDNRAAKISSFEFRCDDTGGRFKKHFRLQPSNNSVIISYIQYINKILTGYELTHKHTFVISLFHVLYFTTAAHWCPVCTNIDTVSAAVM